MISISEYLKKTTVRRVLLFAAAVLLLYLLRDLMTLFLLTFVFIYVFSSAEKLLFRSINKIVRVKSSIIIAFLYIVFLLLFVIIARIYIPLIINQVSDIFKDLSTYVSSIQNEPNPDNIFTKLVIYITKSGDVSKYINTGSSSILSFLSSIGKTGLYILLSLILSLFYMLENKSIRRFLGMFKESRISWIYDDVHFFFVKFKNSFGKVIQTQILIAFINSLLSMLILMILGFPSIIGLGAMVFILGLVPVAGVFISMIPLTVIAYSIGGLTRVLYIVGLIIVLHALESYVLNPKLMSHNTKMPVFFTFLVLLISEHFLGIWGLIVGIPIVMFLLDIFGITPQDDGITT